MRSRQRECLASTQAIGPDVCCVICFRTHDQGPRESPGSAAALGLPWGRCPASWSPIRRVENPQTLGCWGWALPGGRGGYRKPLSCVCPRHGRGAGGGGLGPLEVTFGSASGGGQLATQLQRGVPSGRWEDFPALLKGSQGNFSMAVWWLGICPAIQGRGLYPWSGS